MTLDGNQAVFTRRGESALKSIDDAREASSPPPERAIRISTSAFDRMRELAPGWDKYMLENCYVDWARSKDAARNEDARFLRWVTSYTKGKPAP